MLFDTERVNRIKDKLKSRCESLAVAESVTAGFLQAALASAEGAMEFFEGGLTAYNIGQKCKHLGVSPIQAQRCNCVSEQTAEELAGGVAKAFVSSWGIGVTGYATPTPESNDEVFAFAAFHRDGKAMKQLRMDPGERRGQEAQLFYVATILETFEALLD